MNAPVTLPPGEARQFHWLLRWHVDEVAAALRDEGLDGEALERVLNLCRLHAVEVATLAGAAPRVVRVEASE